MFNRKIKVPTDLEMLEYIYQTYYCEYEKYEIEPSSRQTKIFIPIDCLKIAEHFGVDRDIVFGRLYYHLENKYGYIRDDKDKSVVNFFAFDLNKSVNFPYLASVLADLKDQDNRFNKTKNISIFAIIIAIASLSVSLFGEVTKL